MKLYCLHLITHRHILGYLHQNSQQNHEKPKESRKSKPIDKTSMISNSDGRVTAFRNKRLRSKGLEKKTQSDPY